MTDIDASVKTDSLKYIDRAISYAELAFSTNKKANELLQLIQTAPERLKILQAARKNPHVLAEPAAVFKGFGDNSLDFELRVYINGIDNWWPMLHELNVTIDNAFKKAGVTIAFPQRDVHLDATGPLEVRVVSEPSGSNAHLQPSAAQIESGG